MKISLFLLFSVLFCGGAIMAQQIGSYSVGGVAGTIKPAALSQMASGGPGDGGGGVNPLFMKMDLPLCGPGDGGSGTNPRMCNEEIARSIATITIHISPSTIQSTFLTNQGIINVVIIDTYGMIYYQDNIDTSLCRNLTTDISFLPSGSYAIIYTDVNGQPIKQGKFNIE